MNTENETYLQHFGTFYKNFIDREYPSELDDLAMKTMLVTGSREISRENTSDGQKTMYETYMLLDIEKDIGVRIIHGYTQNQNGGEFLFQRVKYNVDSCTFIENYHESIKNQNLERVPNALWSLGAGYPNLIKYFSEISPAINDILEDLKEKTNDFSNVPSLLIIDNFPVSSGYDFNRLSFSDASEVLVETLGEKFENVLVLNPQDKDFYFHGNPEVVKMIKEDEFLRRIDENSFFRIDGYGPTHCDLPYSIEDSVLNAVSDVYSDKIQEGTFSLLNTEEAERQIIEDLEK